jgi:hypothetical protein
MERSLEAWPVKLRLCALALEAQSLLNWSANGPGADEREARYLRRQSAETLARLRNILAVLPEDASPLTAAVVRLERRLAASGEMLVHDSWLEVSELDRQLAVHRRSGLPPAPNGHADWENRMTRLEALAWIGPHIWSCPAGWLPIFERAARDVEDWGAAIQTRRWRTSQIKEKLGTLRWYGSGDKAFGVVSSFAEETSADLCQACGRPGRLRTDQPWILTLCDAHHAVDAAGGGAVIGRLSYPRRSRG